jgi:hypothetical protein
MNNLKSSTSIESRISQAEERLELFEQALKVKPVNIKREVVRETFDHRLVIFNLVLLFLNIVLLFYK